MPCRLLFLFSLQATVVKSEGLKPDEVVPLSWFVAEITMRILVVSGHVCMYIRMCVCVRACVRVFVCVCFSLHNIEIFRLS